MFAGPVIVALALAGAGSPSAADVPKLSTVGAYGYFASVSLFGGPPSNSGPSPTVTLPPEGSGGPVTTLVPSARAQFGPATILESREAKVSIEAAPGPSGSYASTATVTGVDEPPLPLLYEKVTSTCTARGSELTGSTSLAGQLALSVYTAPDPREGEPKDSIPMPPNPAPNTERTGELTNIGDRFRVVFNEQIRDGELLTVNAIHMYMLGPIAVGDLVIAQSRCRAGVTPSLGDPSPAPAQAEAAALPAPSIAPAPSAGSGPSSSNVPLVAIGGAVLALGAGGAALALRRKGGSRRTPW